VFDSDERFDELYEWLRREWSATRRDVRAQQVFDELALELGGPRRHPLESATFRELLSAPPLRRAA
jgi:hypothetical protein